jgi:predicted  nucleic acid-binding Zn-ribbon protein
MPIHPTLVILLDLAEADLALDKLDRHEARLREAIPAAEQALADAIAAAEAARQAVKNNGREQTRLQGEIATYLTRKQGALRALEQGMGSSDAAERQVQQCGDIIDGLEERQLELMELEASEARAVSTTEQGQRDAEAALTEAKQRLVSELERMNGERTELRATRSHLHLQLDREIQNRYDLLRTRKGTAVATVVDGFCRTCRIAPPRQELADLRRGLMHSCRGCGRYLVVREA